MVSALEGCVSDKVYRRNYVERPTQLWSRQFIAEAADIRWRTFS